ncbi:tRNA uracil-5-methyltransferase-like protein [Leptotrombidium deliense]|uniref:tRNA (uracil(54)-C(5))-methyltransferase n=1 Tax=Leptotrombidium deliense TaxID=299467 RepID=A0A443SMP8_9ACAR|nr:tRNA uracil-5-methyltransferase-like protein [Leptotrombidium deliense]
MPGVYESENENLEDQVNSPNPYNVTSENRFKILDSVITPLHMYSYNHQLNDIYQRISSVLKKLKSRMDSMGVDVMGDERGLVCELDYTRGSPLIDEYRNKDEFTIWPGVDGNRKTVGFLVGEPSKHRSVVCVEPDELKITKRSHRLLAKLLQTYLRDHSPLDTCTDLSADGNWRRFIVRSNNQGEHMLIAILHPQNLSEEAINEEKERLKNYFQPYATEYQIRCFYFQACRGVRCTHEEAPFQLIFGEETIEETINETTFELSPESFFQVNTSAAAVLYNTVLEELNPSKLHTVVDVCCGIGAISLKVAPYVQRVIGIDQSKVAIKDAQKNALKNGIRNCTFYNGYAEHILPSFLSELSQNRVVVTVNPGRGGLPQKVIKTIRSMECIEKVVYISCNPEGKAFNNFVDLMAPEFRFDIEGHPFVATHAVPVHLFPNTTHCELVISFERILN